MKNIFGLSLSPISGPPIKNFFKSQNMNRFFGTDPRTVVKINAGESAAIFNNQSFAAILSDSVNHGFETVYE